MNYLLKAILFCGIAISTQTQVSAQDCGTNPTPAQIEYLTQTREARQTFDITQVADDRYGASIHWVPVQFQEFTTMKAMFNLLVLIGILFTTSCQPAKTSTEKAPGL